MSELNAGNTTGNPAPLGLMGFGMTTVLLNLHNVGFFPLDTMILFVATLRLNRALQVIFYTLTVLFFLLAIGHSSESATITKIVGWVGLLCGFSAIYAGLAQVLNEVYGRTVWPLGTVAKI